MSARRLYLPELSAARRAGSVVLDGAPAHRLRDVLRLRPGDALRLFDGDGLEHEATVAEVARRAVTLTVGPAVSPQAEAPRPVWLVCAFPRAQRGDWLVEKATELGVAGFAQHTAERSVLQPGEGRIDRWRRVAIEAAEQCGRATLPRFEEPPPAAALHLVCEPGVDRSPEEALAAAVERALPAAVSVHIGPEGGWTGGELRDFADRGAVAVGLGPRLLRVETAAIVAAARVLHAVEVAARSADGGATG